MSEFRNPAEYGWLPESAEAMKRFGEVVEPTAETSEDEESDEADNPFEKLDPEKQEEWRSLISKKIVFEPGAENEAQREQLQKLFERVVGYGNVTPELFDALVSQVQIKKEDVVAKNGNKCIGAAVVEHGGLVLLPRFFEGSDETLKYDKEHVLSHEMGELAFRYYKEKGMLDQYKALRAQPPYAVDGDYVEETRAKLGEEDAFREEFAETFGNHMRSRDGIEMLFRRFERVSDREKFKSLLDTEDGRRHINYLLHESLNMKAFLDGGNMDIGDTVKAASEARKSGLEEDEFMDLSSLWDQSLILEEPSAQSMSPWLQMPKEQRPKPKNFISSIWNWLTT